MIRKRIAVAVTFGLIGLVLALLGLVAVSAGNAQSGDISAPLGEITVCLAGAPDCQYSSIQAAVDAANDGDVIKVATGTYTDVHVRPRADLTTTGVITQVVYISKTVDIQGGYATTNWTTPDPEANPTTLDAQGQGRVLYLTGAIIATIDGLRITAGDATGLGGHEPRFGQPEGDAGGGIYVISATVTISGNQVYGNTANPGGGMHLYRSTSAIRGNTITNNSGTACVSYRSDASISGNAFTNNPGPGIELLFGDSTVSGNLIAHNEGTGLYLFIHSSTISDNTIVSNSSPHPGGGVGLTASNGVTLINNTILANSSVDGGGMWLWGESDATLINNVIADNEARHLGSGLYIEKSSARLLHNTIARNYGGDGSGIYVTEEDGVLCTVALTNTVLVSHSMGIRVTGGDTVTVDSILWHSTPITVSQSPKAVVTLQNQYAGDPAFATDGYHLTPTSAAIDRGVDAGVVVDIDSESRPVGEGYDLGADEIWLHKIYLPLVLRNR